MSWVLFNFTLRISPDREYGAAIRGYAPVFDRIPAGVNALHSVGAEIVRKGFGFDLDCVHGVFSG